MATIAIPKKEYELLKRLSAAYVKIAEEIVKTEGVYPYDYKFIRSLMRQAQQDYKKGRFIEAESVDEALRKFHQRRELSMLQNFCVHLKNYRKKFRKNSVLENASFEKILLIQD